MTVITVIPCKRSAAPLLEPRPTRSLRAS